MFDTNKEKKFANYRLKKRKIIELFSISLSTPGINSSVKLKSDNGSHFIAEIFREFLLLVGVKHCLTLAYSKKENAIVERYCSLIPY